MCRGESWQGRIGGHGMAGLVQSRRGLVRHGLERRARGREVSRVEFRYGMDRSGGLGAVESEEQRTSGFD